MSARTGDLAQHPSTQDFNEKMMIMMFIQIHTFEYDEYIYIYTTDKHMTIKYYYNFYSRHIYIYIILH